MLIATKLQLPSPKAGSIVRQGLLDKMRHSLDRRLISIIAMAGAGKTTLLAQAVLQFKLPAVFLSLDEADADLTLMIEYLTTGLAGLFRAEERSALSRILGRELAGLWEEVRRQPDPEMAAVRLINILTKHRSRRLYLIFDDYHVIPAPSPVQHLMDLLLERLPPQIHLMIASRTPLPFAGLPRWTARQEVTEITTADLAFEPADAAAVISSIYGATLPPEEFQRLMERTQGWVTGIHLIMQAAGMHKSLKETLNGYLAANRPLFDYFAAEIYSRETEEIRQFLQRISILSDLDPRACDYLTQRADSSAVLSALEQRNTFISRNKSGSFTIHPLFRTFLQESIEERERLEAWHRRAADFYEKAGDVPRAIDHAIAGRDYGRAAELLVSICDQLNDATQFSRMVRWLKDIPEEVFQAHPRLYLAKYRWLQEIGDAPGQESALQAAVALLQKSRDRYGYCRSLNFLAYHRRNRDLGGAMRLVSKALRLCPASNRHLRADLLNTLASLQIQQGRFSAAEANFSEAVRLFGDQPDNQLWIRNNQAVLQIYRGENNRAVDLYRDFARIYPEGSLPPEAIFIFYGAFRAAMESGQEDTATDFVAQGRRLCKPYWDVASQLLMDEISASLAMYQGRLEQARAEITAIRDRYRELAVEDRADGMEIMLARCCRLAGDIDEAERLLDRVMRRRHLLTREPAGIDDIKPWYQKGLLDAAAGRSAQAVKAASLIARSARRFSSQTGVFYWHLILAKTADRSQRRRHFQLALQCSHRHGYHGTLALEIRADPDLSELFKGMADTKYSAGLIRRLLAAPAGEAKKETAHSLQVRLLGPLEVIRWDGGAIPFRWRTRKVKSLFAYLLMHRGRLCHREELIEAIWPGTPLDRAKKELYHTAFHLKKNLADGFRAAGLDGEAYRNALQHQSQSYRLNPEVAFSLDIEEMEKIRNACSQPLDDDRAENLLKTGLDLYRADFLPEVSDLWGEKQRERFRAMFLFLAEKYGDLCQRTGKLAQALDVYRKVLAVEPLADRVRLAYWQVLRRSGQESAVRQDYENYRRRLKREYGEEPSSDINDAYHNVG